MNIIKTSAQIYNQDEQNCSISHVLLPLNTKDGYIFGLIRFLGKSDQARARLTEVINERLVRFKETINDEANVARRFEQLLQALNEDVSEVIAEEKRFPLTDAQIVVGVIHNNQIFLSGVGNLMALFMHRSAKQRYVIYELTDQLEDKNEQSWKKVFSTILDGELHPGDIFYLATRISAREITLAELQDILTTLPASSSLKRISQFLNRNTVFGALCFQVADDVAHGAPKKVNPMHSMDHLDKTKQDTEHFLGERTPDISGFVTKLTAPLIKKLSSPGTRGYKSLLKRITKVLLQLITLILAGLIRSIALIAKYSWIGIGKLPSIFRRGSQIVRQQPNPKERIDDVIVWFNRLPRFTKYGGLALIVIIFVFSSSILFMHQKQVSEQQISTFDAITSHIDEKVADAQASLIYDDENQARTHLQEAMSLLETVDASGRTQENKVEELKSSLQELSYKIQKVEPVDPSLLAENKDLILTSGTSVDGNIYGISGKSLYRLNELENTWQSLDTQSGSIGDIKHLAVTESGNILFTDTSKQLGKIDLGSLTINPIVSGTNDIKSVEDIAFYNDNLYVLSSSEQQIIKMRPRGDGFEAGTPWITSTSANTDISNARSITIDGTVYVLTNSNIVSFLSGREQSFSLDQISPAMQDPTEIWTDAENEYLYVFEPAQQRIIVLSKEGKLITQYTDEIIGQANSFFVQDTSIIILTSTSAYSFPATHLLK